MLIGTFRILLCMFRLNYICVLRQFLGKINHCWGFPMVSIQSTTVSQCPAKVSHSWEYLKACIHQLLGWMVGPSVTLFSFCLRLSTVTCSVTIQRRRESENLKLGQTDLLPGVGSRDAYASKNVFCIYLAGQYIKGFKILYRSLICEPLIDRPSTRSIINYISGNLKRIWIKYSQRCRRNPHL